MTVRWGKQPGRSFSETCAKTLLMGFISLSLFTGCSSREAAQSDHPTTIVDRTESVKPKRPDPKRPVSEVPSETVVVPRVDAPSMPSQPLPVQIDGPAEQARKNPLDPEKIKAQGIRTHSGTHLTLYTDLPTTDEIRVLPQVFDLAVQQWCAYFKVDPAKMTDWKVTACLIKNREKFNAAGLIPATLPDFAHGYALGDRLFVQEQPSAYYRRHLLLHEGTHAFMFRNFVSAGPPWFMEGMAELLAAHRWDGTTLKMRQMPANREEVPFWGRVKIIKAKVAQQQGLMIEEVMNFGSDAHRSVDAYAWSWAACVFLDSHPEFQERFRAQLKRTIDSSPQFSIEMMEAFGNDWFQVRQQWQVFVMNLDYGFDIPREAIDTVAERPLKVTPQSVTVRADRGWQSTGIRVTQGMQVELAASGRFVIHQETGAPGEPPTVWESEAEGVTIRYHKGQPLGKLLIAVDEIQQRGVTGLVQYGAVGKGGQIQIPTAGVIYLRMNDSPAELKSNQGELQVTLKLAPNAP